MWQIEPGARIEGSHELDRLKVQAPCIVRNPQGGFRLFYTAIGPGRPFTGCQGYLLSAVSTDGVNFTKEEGIRVAPDPQLEHVSRRVLAPSICETEGGWRMYFEARGPATIPTVIGSAFSPDQLHWTMDSGIRLQLADRRLAGPRFLQLDDGTGRLFCCAKGVAGGDESTAVISATTTDGLHFELEPGQRLTTGSHAWDSAGASAAEVHAPQTPNGTWLMVYSVWQQPPPDSVVPLHPANDQNAGDDFAAASIASDMSGYRSRIYSATSDDGLQWSPGELCIEGDGYGGARVDAVHAEDMSIIEYEPGKQRMYYAACDAHGVWRVASATRGAG